MHLLSKLTCRKPDYTSNKHIRLYATNCIIYLHQTTSYYSSTCNGRIVKHSLFTVVDTQTM